MNSSFIALSIVILYFILLILFISKWGRLKNKSVEEFAVAGRSYPWYVVMFTLLASWYVGAVYTSYFAWSVTAGVIGQYILLYTIAGLTIYYLIAPSIWKWGKIHKLHNVPDFIVLRYGSVGLGIFIAVYYILLAIPWMVIAFKVFGYVAYALTDGAISFNLGMVIIVVIVTAYVLIGGQRSVVVSDVFQGIIITLLFSVALIFVAHKLFGGYGSLFKTVLAEKPSLLVVEGSSYWSSIIISGALGAFIWTEMFNKIFLAKSVKDVRSVVKGAPVIATIIGALLMMFALGGFLFPEVLENPEMGLFVMFEKAGGPVLLALVAIVIIAAEMSSSDTVLVVNSVVVAKNIIKPLFKNIEERKTLFWGRVTLIIMSGISLILAMLPEIPMLVFIAIWTYEMLLQVFCIVILGTLWSRGTKKAAIASFSVGIPVTILLMVFSNFTAHTFGGWSAGIIGFIVNAAIYISISLLTPVDKATKEMFDELKEYSLG